MCPDFARQITENQQRLYVYIFSLVGDSSTSWDILQESNLVLWRKQKDFKAGTKFGAWALTVARFQVLAFLRDRKREPLHILTPELLEAFAEDAEIESAQFTDRLAALRRCREQLGRKSRQLIEFYYEKGLSMKEVGDSLDTSASAVKQALYRVRRTLLDCIQAAVPAASE